jgi:hypothetical protein
MQNKVTMLRRHYHRDRTTARAWAQSEPRTNTNADAPASSSVKDEHASSRKSGSAAAQRTEVVPVQLDAQAVADALAPVLTTALIQSPGIQPQQQQPTASDTSRQLWVLVIVLAVLACVSIICALMSLWMAASNARAVSKLQALLLAR